MDGNELAKYRKAAGLSQTKLAMLSGVSRHAISYWENRDWVKASAPAILALARVLDLPDIVDINRARAVWGIRMRALIEAENLATQLYWERLRNQYAIEAGKRRIRCNAKTRKGSHCLCESVPGEKRCRLHGGLSTGPRTQSGRERIADAQRRRWESWRSEKAKLSQ